MKKIFLLIFTLLFMSNILIGCKPRENSESLLNGEIAKVEIYTSNGIGEINSIFSSFYLSFDNEDTLQIFTSVLEDAVREDGIVDIILPDFDFEVTYKNDDRQGFHLWLGEKDQRSSIMRIDDTHTIYTISKEMTNKLINLIQK